MEKIAYENIGNDMITMQYGDNQFTFNPDDMMIVSADNSGDTFDPRVIIDIDDDYIYIS